MADGEITTDRLYGQVDAKATLSRNDTTGSSWDVQGAFRAVLAEDEQDVSVRALSITRSTDLGKLRLGFQEVAWGENFGFPIADIVNVRDLRDPLLLDADWVRLPSFMANYQLTLGQFRMQLVATPVPRATPLPDFGSSLSLLPPALRGLPVTPAPGFPIDRLGRDTEAGARFAFPLGGGVDLSLFYLMHWNRTPVFEADVTAAGPHLSVVQDRVHTMGLGFNKAFETIVLRGDALVTVNDPYQSAAIGPALTGLHSQVVLGADYSSESHLVVGAQYQFDATPGWQLNWVSAHVGKGFFDGKLQPEVFVFRGLGNGDMWIQPMLTWRFLDSVSISARADFVWASHDIGQGLLIPYDGLARAFVWTRVVL
jgi:hypothetical protein